MMDPTTWTVLGGFPAWLDKELNICNSSLELDVHVFGHSSGSEAILERDHAGAPWMLVFVPDTGAQSDEVSIPCPDTFEEAVTWLRMVDAMYGGE